MMELEIDSIRVSLLNYQRVVILKEKESDRYLPIWIGPNEADAIAIKLQEVAVPRPLTHDLLHNVLGELGAEIQHILVSGLDHETFFAKIMVSIGDKTIPIDSRPSDALALAVRARVPIFAEEAVLAKAGVKLDQETGGTIIGSKSEGSEEPRHAPLKPEELEKMSAFSDFIETLDMKGIGERGDKPEGKEGK